MKKKPRSRPTADNPSFELELVAMANGGRAMGWHERRPIFVPYTIPGERIRARIVDDQGRFALAEGLTLLEASADRVYPVCPHFGPGRCGRCQWQHIDYAAQLLLKQDILADQLSRLGGLPDRIIEAALQPTLGSPEQWGYNYHMTLAVNDDHQLGFPGAAQTFGIPGAAIYPIEVCHILH